MSETENDLIKFRNVFLKKCKCGSRFVCQFFDIYKKTGGIYYYVQCLYCNRKSGKRKTEELSAQQWNEMN